MYVGTKHDPVCVYVSIYVISNSYVSDTNIGGLCHLVNTVVISLLTGVLTEHRQVTYVHIQYILPYAYKAHDQY